MNIISIQSSPNPFSITKALSQELINRIQSKIKNPNIIERDIAKNTIPHLSGLSIHAAYTSEKDRSLEMKESLKLGDELIKEVMNADLIIIGAPMWNFSIPSVLKAWIDNIVRVGMTFNYEDGIPKGLIPNNKKVIIVSSRGGVYSEGPYKAFDHQETLLKGVFNFLGIQDVEIITCEGIRGEDPRNKAIEICSEKINKIITKLQ